MVQVLEVSKWRTMPLTIILVLLVCPGALFTLKSRGESRVQSRQVKLFTILDRLRSGVNDVLDYGRYVESGVDLHNDLHIESSDVGDENMFYSGLQWQDEEQGAISEMESSTNAFSVSKEILSTPHKNNLNAFKEKFIPRADEIRGNDLTNYFEQGGNVIRYEEPFKVFWNVPSKACHNFNITLHPEQYGFTVNKDENFTGDQIVLMYAPGVFPQILANGTVINGGIPQLGNLRQHIHKLILDIQRDIPDMEFDGVGVIDMESWEPQFANAHAQYRHLAVDTARRQHPNWSEQMLEERAREDFDWWARLFLQTTLQTAKKARPDAAWGYYQYPLCKNLAVKNGTCPAAVRQSNDHLLWLLGESTTLYPSLYLFLHGYSDRDRYSMVSGRIDEVLRLAGSTPVYPYTWFQYHDDKDLLPQIDLESMLGQVKTRGLAGAVMWGSTTDCDSAQRCQKLKDYLSTTLGPLVQQLTGGTSWR